MEAPKNHSINHVQIEESPCCQLVDKGVKALAVSLALAAIGTTIAALPVFAVVPVALPVVLGIGAVALITVIAIRILLKRNSAKEVENSLDPLQDEKVEPLPEEKKNEDKIDSIGLVIDRYIEVIELVNKFFTWETTLTEEPMRIVISTATIGQVKCKINIEFRSLKEKLHTQLGPDLENKEEIEKLDALLERLCLSVCFPTKYISSDIATELGDLYLTLVMR